MQKTINLNYFDHGMEDTFFEIGFEGTSNDDCLAISKIKSDSILVFDKQKVYGTTFKTLEELKNNKMVKNIKIYKNDSKIIYETDPKFFRPSDEIFKIINESESSGFCDFIPINSHYLILENGKYYKIPYTKTDLVDTNFFTFKDRHLVNRFVKGEISISDLKSKLSDRSKQILLNGIVGNDNDYESKILEYLNNFQGYPFIYPKHGLKDISELISRVNAVNGISYLLDSTLSVFELTKISGNTDHVNIINNLTDQVLPTKSKGKCSEQNEEIGICECEEEVDIFDRFNTNGDDESEENLDINNDHTGQLYINERRCCHENRNNSSLLVCTGKSINTEEEFSNLLKNFNIADICPSPLFVQGLNLKIKVEDITLRNQVIDFTSAPNDKVKEIIYKANLSYGKMFNYMSDGYKYFINSEHGNIFFKKLYKKELTGTKKYVRVINISFKLLKSRFFAWVYNGYEFIQVLMIDFNSKCCKKDTYIVYIIKYENQVTDKDLEIFNIYDCDILTDVSFQVWDYKHVVYL